MPQHEHRGSEADDVLAVNPLFARPGEETVPRWRIPDGEMLPDSAYQIIADEIFLDGNARHYAGREAQGVGHSRSTSSAARAASSYRRR